MTHHLRSSPITHHPLRERKRGRRREEEREGEIGRGRGQRGEK